MSAMVSRYFDFSVRSITVRSITITLIWGFLLLSSCTMVSAEKMTTSLTIGLLPKEPTIDQSYRVTGILTTSSGEPLGNKRVVLESTQSNPDNQGKFAFIAIKETTRLGTFEFFRPKDTPPEYLRVRYDGNVLYEAARSTVIPVRGVGTATPQIRQGRVGSLTVSTNPTGADIFVDTILRGSTPGSIGGLAEGSHTLELRKPGYQNESMEVYISPDRSTSLEISLNPEGLGYTKTGFSSSLSFTKNETQHLGKPDFSLDIPGLSISMYGNSTSSTDSSVSGLRTTTLVSNNSVGGGYDVMVLMTDH